MLPAASFDELNRLIKAKRSMPYEKYFGEMELKETNFFGSNHGRKIYICHDFTFYYATIQFF